MLLHHHLKLPTIEIKLLSHEGKVPNIEVKLIVCGVVYRCSEVAHYYSEIFYQCYKSCLLMFVKILSEGSKLHLVVFMLLHHATNMLA